MRKRKEILRPTNERWEALSNEGHLGNFLCARIEACWELVDNVVVEGSQQSFVAR